MATTETMAEAEAAEIRRFWAQTDIAAAWATKVHDKIPEGAPERKMVNHAIDSYVRNAEYRDPKYMLEHATTLVCKIHGILSMAECRKLPWVHDNSLIVAYSEQQRMLDEVEAKHRPFVPKGSFIELQEKRKAAAREKEKKDRAEMEAHIQKYREEQRQKQQQTEQQQQCT